MSRGNDLAEAVAHHQAGRLDQAEAHYRRALQQDRFNPTILHNLGLLRASVGDLHEAGKLIGQAVSLRGNVAEFHSNYGNVLAALGRDVEAAAAYERALKLNPRFADAAFNLGIVQAKLGRGREAAENYRRALSANPSFWPALLNLANLLDEQDRFADAQPLYERAAALAPNAPAINYGFARALNRQGDNTRAEEFYRRSLAADATHPETHNNLGLCLLARGDFAAGWPELEWRHRKSDAPARRFVGRDWRGEALAGRRLLVSAEQAAGDQILFASMFADLRRFGGTIIIECDARLVPLFRRSFPDFEICAMQDPPHIPGGFDIEIPGGSLGLHLRPDFASFAGSPSPYLQPDAAARDAIRARYAALGDGPVIGLAWRSQRQELGAAKSTRLLDWAPILRDRRAVFIDLQYGDTADERAQIQRDLGITIHRDDQIDQMQNLDAFAAQVAALDHVISISNTTVHVAGALGVPTWALVPRGKGMHWYWFSDRDDSPLYPRLRLFRQATRGAWADVIARVAACAFPTRRAA